ncbi:hypothetical protein N7539_001378 [Penicillium diatomitis]|uniref:Uncharacterized protein n=1 Tax=Penicillium diatomitis TaxID=2819901 RepID=A0A9W9XGL7_9EURO|nr:uncharacterized protein N7539_001378 [Penicillium diatomitis]KAJ5492632.1 hypothetical protein N7539_001378 [Penicillium diatomitis]
MQLNLTETISKSKCSRLISMTHSSKERIENSDTAMSQPRNGVARSNDVGIKLFSSALVVVSQPPLSLFLCISFASHVENVADIDPAETLTAQTVQAIQDSELGPGVIATCVTQSRIILHYIPEHPGAPEKGPMPHVTVYLIAMLRPSEKTTANALSGLALGQVLFHERQSVQQLTVLQGTHEIKLAVIPEAQSAIGYIPRLSRDTEA